MITTLTIVMMLSTNPEPPTDDVPLAQKDQGIRLTSGVGRSAGALVGTAIGVVVTGASGAFVFFASWIVLGGMRSFDHGFTEAVIASCATYALGALFLVPLGAWLGHKVAGGDGIYLAALAGGAVGVTVGAALITAGAMMIDSGSKNAGGGLLIAALGAGAFVAGPIIGLELSHHSLAPRVGVAPTKHGGGMVSLAWEI